MKKYNKSRIDKALLLLEEAAQEKKKELLKHIDGKYKNVRHLFVNEVKDNSHGIRHAIHDAIGHGEEVIKDKIHKGEDLYHHIDKAVNQKVKEMDKRVCENPYSYIVGAGLASLVLGFLIANHHGKGDL